MVTFLTVELARGHHNQCMYEVLGTVSLLIVYRIQKTGVYV